MNPAEIMRALSDAVPPGWWEEVGGLEYVLKDENDAESGWFISAGQQWTISSLGDRVMVMSWREGRDSDHGTGLGQPCKTVDEVVDRVLGRRLA